MHRITTSRNLCKNKFLDTIDANLVVSVVRDNLRLWRDVDVEAYLVFAKMVLATGNKLF